MAAHHFTDCHERCRLLAARIGLCFARGVLPRLRSTVRAVYRQLARPVRPRRLVMPRRERPIGAQEEVAVTYDQNAFDGVGSQLQRIYGLYALSRGLGLKYVHTPLGRVDYQGLMPLLTGRTDGDFAARYNAFYSLPSDDFDLDGCERLLVPYPNEQRVEHHRTRAAATGRPVLLQAHEPYGYTDRHPEAYRVLREVSPYREFPNSGPRGQSASASTCAAATRYSLETRGSCPTHTTCARAARW